MVARNTTYRDKLYNVQPGDLIMRMLSGKVPMELKVSEITEDKIICGPYEFSRETGGEIDKDLGWDGVVTKPTGSFITFYKESLEPLNDKEPE